MKKYDLLRAIAFVLPLLLITILLYLKFSGSALYSYLVSEDSITEYLQAVAYLATGGIFIIAGIRSSILTFRIHKILFIIVGLGVVLIAMEEISWGQRLFGITTPEWFQKHNIQNEISIHNLEPVQKTIHFFYALTGLVFSFGWIPFRYNFKNNTLAPGIISFIRIVKPHWYLMTYFLPLFFFYTFLILSGNPGNYFTFNDQEITELLLSLGLLLYSYLILRSLNQWRHEYPI